MRIAIVGYGRMGRTTEQVALEMGHDVVARLDVDDPITTGSLGGADVAIEFSVPEAAPRNLIQIAQAGVDAASGTTGWYDQVQRVRAAVESAGTGLLAAPNFSLGVAVFSRLVREAARLVARVPDYDVHLHEAHHRHKIDHPSGTARALADDIVSHLDRKHTWTVAPPEGPPEPGAVYISVTRAGEIPGSHVVALEGPHDRIELRHDARDRGGFARGAVEGALWVRGRPGLHTLEDWLDDRFGSPSRP